MLNINELGLSIVDNINKVELTYILFSSSYILWGELGENGRFVQFKNDQISEIEDAYNRYLEDIAKKNRNNVRALVGKEDKVEVIKIKLRTKITK